MRNQNDTVSIRTNSSRMKSNFSSLRFNCATVIGLVVFGLLLSSCSDKSAPSATTAKAGESGKVIIKGSNTIGEELAPRLIAAYKKDHSSANFELESKATGYGLAALMAGLCDIAGASRTPIKEELETAQS